MKTNNDINKRLKITLTKTAYIKIKDAIIRNELKPGEVISENTLAEYLQMSRTPVREALKMLQKDDLIETIPGSGTFVKTISEKELRDLYPVRVALECLALKEAINYFNENEINTIIEEWEKFKLNYRDRNEVDWECLYAADSHLHKMIIIKSKNVFLKHLYEILENKITRYRRLSVSYSKNVEDTINQHIELMKLIKEKNLDMATEKMKKHLFDAMESIVKPI